MFDLQPPRRVSTLRRAGIDIDGSERRLWGREATFDQVHVTTPGRQTRRQWLTAPPMGHLDLTDEIRPPTPC